MPVSIGLGEPIVGNRAGPATYVFVTVWSRQSASVTELFGSVPRRRDPASWCVVPRPSRRPSPLASEGLYGRIVGSWLALTPLAITCEFLRTSIGLPFAKVAATASEAASIAFHSSWSAALGCRLTQARRVWNSS